ncbi:HEAT repeat domain-containing protein [Amycolatopsis sp. FDAARGOS 1241]|uniref:HEAT repeat domain-containing protein n=1 Tax=Amycolatopsis sp. FDAARGOS 1241 TaxID=2778070 RepID=UPI00194FDFAD|nr:HEAT repeat domain-containing protein [Amycolatopsis sp. FDAARGOS 1241]QRP43116.1 HEAT repeat domain-containing protein [Amycolatopsis sp. FDAARGOS 1241]
MTNKDLNTLAAGSSHAWLRFDESNRFSYWYGRHAPPRELPRPLTRAALAEAACHASGHVREQVIPALSRSADPEALPLLVIRCTDWVRQVRTAARRALLARLARTDLVPLLPLTTALSRRLGDGWLDEHLLHPVLTSADLLDEALTVDDFRTRRLILDLAIDAGLLSDHRLASLARDDTDSVVRTRAGNLVLDHGDPALAQAMRRDGPPRIRTRALQLLGQAHDYLDEPSSLVRSMAQALVLDAGDHPAPHYREALAHGVSTPATVAGLGETGTAADVDLLRDHFTHPRPRVRAAAVRGLRRLLADPTDPRAVELARPLLADPSPGVVRAAATVVAGRLGQADRPYLLALTAQDEPKHVRRAGVALLRGMSEWSRLAIDLQLLSAPDEPLADEARRDLDEWCRWPTTTYTRPSPQLAAQIDALLSALEPRLGEDFTNYLRRVAST